MTNVRTFLLDAEESFYSIPHDTPLVKTRECIENQGMVLFQNRVGVSVDSFLELLVLYFKFMFIVLEGNVFTQKSSVCIGSHLW